MVKKNKDLHKPKRALSAWMFYCADKRKELLAGGMKVTEASKELGKMWGGMDDTAKESYNKQATKDKIRYAKAMEGYVPPPQEGGDDDSEEKVKKPRVKRNPSGYLLYGGDARPKIKLESPDMKASEVMKQIGAGWKKLTDGERGVWNAKSAKAGAKAKADA
jgi:hypothetical protein